MYAYFTTRSVRANIHMDFVCSWSSTLLLGKLRILTFQFSHVQRELKFDTQGLKSD